MKQRPLIIVQLIHIQGPEPINGKFLEFSDFPIQIGRHPKCHLQFPKDLAVISRLHAEILREGNRFKLVDKSSNGIFIKSQKITQETYLNHGDVLTFAEESGPKISFLTEIKENPQEQPVDNQLHQQPSEPPKVPEPPPQMELKTQEVLPPVNEKPPATQPAPSSIPEEPTKITLIVQYGPAIESFKMLPITMGNNPGSDDFVLNHPNVYERHVSIFFSQGNYGVKDMTGKGLVLINHIPVKTQVFLKPNDRLSLTQNGPHFQFFAGGRLAEAEAPAIEDTADVDYPDHEMPQYEDSKQDKSLFKKIFGG